MNTLLLPLIGGVLGTIGMTLFLFIPKWLGCGRVDVIRAVGALITHRSENAFKPGLILHISSGIIFAYIYDAILTLSHIPFNLKTVMGVDKLV